MRGYVQKAFATKSAISLKRSSLGQSREWVTQSDPWPKWPIELLTHDPCDPWPMGHRGLHPILAQALHRFIDYPALYLDIVYVHTPLSCYILAHVSKLHTLAPVNLVHRCIDIIILQLAYLNVNLELRQSHAQLHKHHRLTRYIIIATI